MATIQIIRQCCQHYSTPSTLDMTAKQKFYQWWRSPSRHGSVRQYASEHRSPQVKQIAKGVFQIRFRDDESWLLPDDWAVNYESKLVADLRTAVSVVSKVIPPDELLSLLPDDLVKTIGNARCNSLLHSGVMVLGERHSELSEKLRKCESANQTLSTSLEKERSEHSKTKGKLDKLRNQVKDFFLKYQDLTLMCSKTKLNELWDESGLSGVIKTKD